MSEQREQRNINTTQVARYLSHAFARATQPLGNRASKGSDLYRLQVDFCYLIDDITRGPKYIIPKVIARANDFIERIVQEQK